MNKPTSIIQFNQKEHDRRAESYDLNHPEIFNIIEQRRIAQELKKALSQIRTGSKDSLVLDFGAGTGNLSHHLLDSNVNVLAADISEKSLEQLKIKISAGNQLQTTILNGVNLSQFADNTFDMIATYSVLHHIPDYLKIIKEFLRVIKPGGIIFIDHEVCPSYWHKNKAYQKYLYELGGNFREHHLMELGVRWHIIFLLKWFKNIFPEIISLKSWNELVRNKSANIKKTPILTSDIHVFKHDHIEWDYIKNILMPWCEIINEKDYLVCRELSDQPVTWQLWNSKCADMKMLVVRKK